MRRYHILPIFLSMALVFTTCNDDEPDILQTSGGNTNSNATFSYINGVTENSGTTNFYDIAKRLEMPRLTGGTNNLFVVHTVPTYGINYCMEYDCSMKAQRWAAFQWTSSNSKKTTSRTDAWSVDPLIPRNYQTTGDDHTGNGYTRGHIVSSEDRVCSREANEQTFYYSNMHPQLYEFNTQGIWWNIENLLMHNRLNKDSFRDTLFVVKGGTIAPVNLDGKEVSGYTWVQGRGQKLACPKYFFMAVLCKKNADKTQGGYKAIGFWMEHKANTDDNYAKYAVSIDKLEELTGLDFFCNLPDDMERQVESNLTLSAWGLK